MQSDALGPVDPNERVEVSLILRPRQPLGELEKPMSREEYAASYGADPNDMSTVEHFARAHGLEVIESSQPRRTVRLGGRAADVASAFGVSLQRRRLGDGTEFRAPDEVVKIPSELQGVVEGVFGLDTRPVATHHE